MFLEDWQENKWVGIIAGAIFAICVSTLVFSIARKNITEKRDYEKGFQEWKARHIFDEEGHAIAEKGVEEE